MTPDEALTVIRKELSESFGEALAGRIVTSARSAANAAEQDIDARNFAGIVQALRADERVIGMLGALGVRDRCLKWEQLIR